MVLSNVDISFNISCLRVTVLNILVNTRHCLYESGFEVVSQSTLTFPFSDVQ